MLELVLEMNVQVSPSGEVYIDQKDGDDLLFQAPTMKSPFITAIVVMEVLLEMDGVELDVLLYADSYQFDTASSNDLMM